MNANFWPGRRVLVTGATGIVGSWLVKDLLAKGAHVVALIRDSDPRSEFYRSGDCNNVGVVNGELEDIWDLERAINEHEIDTVFHLAAQPIVGAAHRMPIQTFEANIRGTYNLLEACRLHSQLVKRIVVASSDKAYGPLKTLPYTEDMPLRGVYPYEVSKSCADLVTQSYHSTYGVPAVIARCGNIYGGGDLNWSRIIPGTIRSLFQEERPVVRSDGTYVRDYIFVKDVVSAYERLAEDLESKKLGGHAFNFSPERAVTVLEIVDKLRDIMGCGHLTPEIINTATGEIHSQYLDSTKAKKILGWTPKYSLEQGLVETVDWYRKYLQVPTAKPLRVAGGRKGNS